MKQNHTILGLDPGLRTAGYGVLEVTTDRVQVAEAGVITCEPGDDPDNLAPRVKTLFDGLCEILDQWKPTALVVEQLYAHYEHPRTAILMAHARGCFLLAGAQRGIDVLSYPATAIKKTITGNGRASKEQMQNAIRRELGLDKLPEPHDVADALAIALCHHYKTGTPAHGGASRATYTAVNRNRLFGPKPESA